MPFLVANANENCYHCRCRSSDFATKKISQQFPSVDSQPDHQPTLRAYASAIQENTSMQPRPALRPLAADISHPELSASASGRRAALLPLGAMMAAAALPAINVNTQREQNIGYQGIKTTVGKTPQLLRDVPQAVTVVTEQLIQDRGADTLKEALRNV